MENMWWRDLVPCQKVWVARDHSQNVDHYKDIDTFESREDYDAFVNLNSGDEVMILESGVWWDDNPWETAERCPLALIDRDDGYIFFLHEKVLQAGYFSPNAL